MKVCVISIKECWEDENGWASYGGFPRQMTAIASLFDGMDLLVVGSKPRSGGLPLPASARVVAMDEPAGADARRKLSVALRLPYYIGTMARHVRQADVVHLPLPGDMALLGMLVAFAMRKPVLARYGGSWAATAQTTFMNRVTRTLMRLFAGGRNVMIATGEGARPPEKNIEWLFSTSLTEAEIRSISPVLDRGVRPTPRLLYAGRLSPEKGVVELVRAMALLRQSGVQPVPHLTMAGDGPLRAELEALAKELGCSDIITFTGQLDRADLSAAFLASDISVQPSLTESFGKAWIDGMAHGLPVITCLIGSAQACIGADGERGWIVPPGDVPALAGAIRNAITADIDWLGLRQRCRRYAEGFTIEVWRERITTMCAARWNCNIRNGKLTHERDNSDAIFLGA